VYLLIFLSQPWKTTKQKLRELYAEIRETVRYLNSMEKSFGGLYQHDIKKIRLSINYVFVDLPNVQTFAPKLFNKRYMTKLLLTCMNQIVIACIIYLTDDNSVIFWMEPKMLMIKKLKKCVKLKEHVFNCYDKAVNKLMAEGREPFQFSYNTSFGDFIAFINRLDRVSEY